VEDNPDDEALTMRALRRNNLDNEVRVARSGEDALALLFGELPHERPFVPELILLDLNLPKVDGLEVLRRIRADARTRTLPVVMLTTSTEPTDLARSYELGVNSYIRKPVDFLEFVETVGQIGRYWLQLNVTVKRSET
jgi:two-component system response regulator